MPKSICDCCGGDYLWRWEEAFEKFGFNDGDGQVETGTVEHILNVAGYDTRSEQWGLHNTIILSIQKDGIEYMPVDHPTIMIGYDDPRSYLPEDIIALLDRELADAPCEATGG